MQDQTNNPKPKQEDFPPAPTGNASNPSHDTDAPQGNQLLDAKAEKYLREVASPEDYPDEQDWEAANQTIEQEKEDDTPKAP